MPPNRAILIQCIAEYVAYITPHLRQAITQIRPTFYNREKEILEWIIAEELELIYSLFVINHKHDHEVYDLIHNKLNLILPRSLSVLTKEYIKAPIIYGDSNLISISITSLDLYIYYYSLIGK
jgi:hypothetical protein